MTLLSSPFEIFDIGDGESVEITVTRWEQGDATVMTREDGSTFPIAPLRLHLTAPIAPGRFPYIDVTSKRLAPTLLPLLAGIPPARKTLRISKYGTAPKAVFSVETLAVK